MGKKNSSKSSKGKVGNSKQPSPAKHWFLTLNNYTKEDILLLSSNSSIERYCFQEEIGESGTPHLQGHFEFCTKVRPCSVFGKLGHWEKTHHRRAAIEYCSKLDSRNGKTYIKNFPKSLWRKPNILQEDQLYDWQRTIALKCEEEPDDRTINWIFDLTGNKGKSALVKYLIHNYHGMLISGKGCDIKYQIASAELPPDVILYDIPRTCEGYVNYSALEEIKNGCFCSSKYESKMILMASPHIFCFANFEPMFDKMSQDRWKVTNLE